MAEVHTTPAKRTIVIAVDRSQQAEQAFDWYVSTIHRPDNHVVLVHVPEVTAAAMSKGTRSEDEIRRMMELEKKENQEMTSKYNAKMEHAGLHGDYREVYGKPGEALVNAAKHEKAAVIIMGTRGMGTVRRTIMGSVSDYVVHHSHTPVIVCRH